MKISGLSGLDAKLLKAIEEFRGFVPDEGFDACKQTSAQFTQFAIEYGLNARWINLCGGPSDLRPQGSWVDMPRQHWIHYVTKVGKVYVDWTASQFGDSSSSPSLSIDSTGWDREYDVTDALEDYLSELDETLEEDFLGALDRF